MIKLEEHIVEIEGVKYVTLEIAEAAIAANINQSKLDEAVSGIQEAIRDMDNSLKDALNDD